MATKNTHSHVTPASTKHTKKPAKAKVLQMPKRTAPEKKVVRTPEEAERERESALLAANTDEPC